MSIREAKEFLKAVQTLTEKIIKNEIVLDL